MKIMKRPNLFDFATKELSQDAFFGVVAAMGGTGECAV